MKTTLLFLRDGADPARVQSALARRGSSGTLVADGSNRTAIVVRGPLDTTDLPEVTDVLVSPSEHPLVDAVEPDVDVAGLRVGPGLLPVLVAGPCAVEDATTLDAIAKAVADSGATILRGGAFKPRTSPYSFQGLGLEGLKLLRDAGDRYHLRVVTEAMSIPDLPVVAEYADLLQIGSRNMQNFALLRAAARMGKPALLKRGASATVREWLLAAEYLLEGGCPGVILCERGVRTFAQPSRYTLDLSAVAWILEHTQLPVIVDPSHASGQRDLVCRLSRAAIALGAHGLMIDVHVDAGLARCDGPQALDPRAFERLVREVRR